MTPQLPTLREALWVWARIGVLSFGGPAGQIALLHRECVEQRRWVGERRFLHALSFCTLLPGPEATQLATYLGWLMHGPVGGVAACVLFVLPGAALLLLLSILYFAAAHLPAIDGLFYGLKCAVLALVLQALLRIGQRALKTRTALVLAGLAFLGLFVFALPFPVIVLSAGALGALAPKRVLADHPPGAALEQFHRKCVRLVKKLLAKTKDRAFSAPSDGSSQAENALERDRLRLLENSCRSRSRPLFWRACSSRLKSTQSDHALAETPGLIDALLAADPRRPARLAAGARRAGLVALGLWLVPLACLKIFVPGRFADIAWFFSKMAVVTLGGAYAVLAYVAQDAVQYYHWLSPADMLAGLGLAETTPGPLILVLQFVGFLAGAHAPGKLHGISGGLAASAITLWVTFLPCLVFVFLGAPLVESLAENRALRAALAAITAAVVGVIANLSVWFGLHVMFARLEPVRAGPIHFEWPILASLDPLALMLAGLAGLLVMRLRWPVPATLAITAATGLVLRVLAN